MKSSLHLQAVSGVFCTRDGGSSSFKRWYLIAIRTGRQGVGRLQMDQNTDKRLALVNAVMNIRVPETARNFMTG